MADEPITDTPPTRPNGEPRPSRKSRTPRETPPASSDAGGDKTPPPRRPSRSSNRDRIRTGLIETYVGIGGGLQMVGMIRSDPGVLGSAQAIVGNAEAAADAWMTLADQNPAVMRALSTFVEGSAIAGLVIAHAPMVMPLLQSRGLFGEDMAKMQAASVGFAPPSPNGAAPEGDPEA